VFRESHLSPIPHLHYGGYDACLVLDTAKYALKTFYPTYYEDRQQKNDCFAFNDEGWNAVPKETIKNEDCLGFSKNEHEWNVQNPHQLPLDQIDAIIFRDETFYSEDHRERIRDAIITHIAFKKRMNLSQLNTLMAKLFTVKYDIDARIFKDGLPIFEEKIETVAVCPSVAGIHPMINAPAHPFLKTVKGCTIIDENGYYET